MNEYDSSKMADLLDATHGYQLTDVAEEADAVTRSIREKAQESLLPSIRSLETTKRENPDLIIGVGGRVPPRRRAELPVNAPITS